MSIDNQNSLTRLRMGLWVIGAVVVIAAILVVVVGLRKSSQEEAAELTPAVMAQMTDRPAASETDLLTAAPFTSTVVSTPTRTPVPMEPGEIRISETDGMELVYIPEGAFLMGSEWGDEDELPVHEVYLNAYLIDRTEVTNAMFAAFLNEMGNQTEGIGDQWFDTQNDSIQQIGRDWFVMDDIEQQHPVTYVTWYGARAYCRWAGRRLPTEAEWEHAARGVNNYTYPWGNNTPTCLLANYETCEGGTTIVGSLPAGATTDGVMDMAGNVWEWVSDKYAVDYYERSPHDNPRGASSGFERVLRGGSWINDQNYMRATDRLSFYQYYSGSHIGFRCAVSADELGNIPFPATAVAHSETEAHTSNALQVGISLFGEDQVIFISDEASYFGQQPHQTKPMSTLNKSFKTQ